MLGIDWCLLLCRTFACKLVTNDALTYCSLDIARSLINICLYLLFYKVAVSDFVLKFYIVVCYIITWKNETYMYIKYIFFAFTFDLFAQKCWAVPLYCNFYYCYQREQEALKFLAGFLGKKEGGGTFKNSGDVGQANTGCPCIVQIHIVWSLL